MYIIYKLYLYIYQYIYIIYHTFIRNIFNGFFSFKCKNFITTSSNEISNSAYINALFEYLKNK